MSACARARGGAGGGIDACVAGLPRYGPSQQPLQGTEPCAGTCGPNAEAARLAASAAIGFMPIGAPGVLSPGATASWAAKAVYK